MQENAASARATDTDHAPTRMVARQVSHLLFARGRRWVGMIGADPLTAFILDVFVGAGMQHQPYRAPSDGAWIGVEAGATMSRPVSSSAVAQSMRIPLTTVRRHAADLIAAGLLERRPRGLLVAPSFFGDPGLAAFARADAAEVARVMEALALAGYAPARQWSPAMSDVVPVGVVERLIQMFAMRVLETFTTHHDGFLPGGIVAAIVAANVRSITADPVLAARYGADHSPPPDTMRVPVSVRALAQELDLPFETVRRRVAALEQAGTVVRCDRGVIVPGRVLRTPEHLDNNQRITAHFDQLAKTLLSLARRPGQAS